MSKKLLIIKIIILTIPIFFWIQFAGSECVLSNINNDLISLICTFFCLSRYAYCLCVIPLIYLYLIWIIAKNIKESVILFSLSYIFQLLGYLIECYVYYNYISSDEVTYALIKASSLLLAIIVGVGYIFGIFIYILIKKIIKILK